MAGSPQFSEEEITTALMAIIAWAGNTAAASRYLKAEKGISVAQPTLYEWRQKYAIKFDQLREEYSGQMEKQLAHELRDTAALAVAGMQLATEKATERLEAGDDQDPARTAANLARVSQSSIDKLMTVTSRPARIVENRGAQELIRSLAAMGVLKIPELTEGTEVEEGDGQ